MNYHIEKFKDYKAEKPAYINNDNGKILPW